MDVVCRSSAKYFVQILYRLFSAELVKKREGNVNLIYCWWVYYEGWLLLGFPVFQPFLLGCVKYFVLLSYSLKIYVTKLTWSYISLLLQHANGSSYAWNNFDFWCLTWRLSSSFGITVTILYNISCTARIFSLFESFGVGKWFIAFYIHDY